MKPMILSRFAYTPFPEQCTKDARKILSKHSERFIYLITLQVIAKAMGELTNFRRALN